ITICRSCKSEEGEWKAEKSLLVPTLRVGTPVRDALRPECADPCGCSCCPDGPQSGRTWVPTRSVGTSTTEKSLLVPTLRVGTPVRDALRPECADPCGCSCCPDG